MFEAAHILDTFRQKLAGQEHLTFSPAVIVGGTQITYDCAVRGTAFGKDNVIPEQAVITGDMRALSAEQFTAAQRVMSAIVGQSLPRPRRSPSTRISGDGPDRGNRRLLSRSGQPGRRRRQVTAVNPDRAGARMFLSWPESADDSRRHRHAGMAVTPSAKPPTWPRSPQIARAAALSRLAASNQP
jgi:glutamate carboxypeptidase